MRYANDRQKHTHYNISHFTPLVAFVSTFITNTGAVNVAILIKSITCLYRIITQAACWPKLSNDMCQNSTPHSSVTAQPILMKFDTYIRKTIHHAKRYFDRTTRVGWANTQFATVRFLSLSFFRHAHRSHWWTDFDDLYMLYDVFPQMMYLLRVLLIYLPI